MWADTALVWQALTFYSLSSFNWNLVCLYLSPSEAVIMHEPLPCRKLVIIPWYYSLLGDILYMTCVHSVSKLLVVCAWLLYTGLTASHLWYACCLTNLHPGCMWQWQVYLACVAYRSCTMDCKTLASGVFLYNIMAKEDYHLFPLLL